MKIENTKCLNYNINDNKLILEVINTSIENIKSDLLNKAELNVYTDNEEPTLVETIFGFVKAVSITDRLDGSFIVILTQVSELEERITLLENALNDMIFGESEVNEDVSIFEETDTNGEDD